VSFPEMLTSNLNVGVGVGGGIAERKFEMQEMLKDI